MKPYLLFILCISFLGSIDHIPSVFAGLGQPETSIEKDRKALRGVRKLLPNKGLSVHEITTDGQIIREYVSPDGIVFAITWRGTTHPDPTLILGSYLSEGKKALSDAPIPRGRAMVNVQTSHLVIQKSGHMGDVRGKAYIPELLPEGITSEDLT